MNFPNEIKMRLIDNIVDMKKTLTYFKRAAGRVKCIVHTFHSKSVRDGSYPFVKQRNKLTLVDVRDLMYLSKAFQKLDVNDHVGLSLLKLKTVDVVRSLRNNKMDWRLLYHGVLSCLFFLDSFIPYAKLRYDLGHTLFIIPEEAAYPEDQEVAAILRKLKFEDIILTGPKRGFLKIPVELKKRRKVNHD